MFNKLSYQGNANLNFFEIYLFPVSITKISKNKWRHMLESTQRKGNTHSLLEGKQTCTATVDVSAAFLRKLRKDPAIPRLGTYPKGFRSSYRDNCSFIILAALLIIARNWKQPKCPTSNCSINNAKVIH